MNHTLTLIKKIHSINHIILPVSLLLTGDIVIAAFSFFLKPDYAVSNQIPCTILTEQNISLSDNAGVNIEETTSLSISTESFAASSRSISAEAFAASSRSISAEAFAASSHSISAVDFAASSHSISAEAFAASSRSTAADASKGTSPGIPERSLFSERTVSAPVYDGTDGQNTDFSVSAYASGTLVNAWPEQYSNDFSGIYLNTDIEQSYMSAWWPSPSGSISRSPAWLNMGEISAIADLQSGDVVVWAEGDSPDWVNHIAIVVDVAADGYSFTSADGSTNTPTGVAFRVHYDLYNSNSSYGKVLVWRNTENGPAIGQAVKDFAQGIIDNQNCSMAQQWSDISWCYCFVASALLSVG